MDEYLVELLSQGLDPRDRAVEYVEAALELLREAREELEKGDAGQAAERAYAWLREGKRPTEHQGGPPRGGVGDL